jgi:hypothetical protein
VPNIRQAQKTQNPEAQTVGWEPIHPVRKGKSLWRYLKQGKISREEIDQRARVLKNDLTMALSKTRRIRDPENRRLLRELAWHHKRGSLLRFLDNPTTEPKEQPCRAGRWTKRSLRAKGLASSQPGAKPQDQSIIWPRGLKARPHHPPEHT